MKKRQSVKTWISEIKEVYLCPFKCRWCGKDSLKGALVYVGDLRGIDICEDCYRRLAGDEEKSDRKCGDG